MSKLANLPALERCFRLALWAVAVAFAYFLTDLGALALRDMPRLEAPVVEARLDPAIEARLAAARSSAVQAAADLAAANQATQKARIDHQSAAEVHRNWLATLGTTRKADRDPELLARAQGVESLREALRKAEQALQVEQIADREARKAVEVVEAQAAEARQELARQAQDLRERQSLRVFGYRGAFALPLLGLGVHLIARHRTSRYWPFVYGYAFFAVSVFFFELVPYLPTMGGYVRTVVGIALTLMAGTWGIRGLQSYLARLQASSAANEAARRQHIRYERALAAIDKQDCPGCDRSVRYAAKEAVDFCMHCGLRLFRACTHCATRSSSFFPFCPGCGQAHRAPAAEATVNATATDALPKPAACA